MCTIQLCSINPFTQILAFVDSHVNRSVIVQLRLLYLIDIKPCYGTLVSIRVWLWWRTLRAPDMHISMTLIPRNKSLKKTARTRPTSGSACTIKIISHQRQNVSISLVDPSILIDWTNPIPILGVSGVFFSFLSIYFIENPVSKQCRPRSDAA